MQIPIPWRTTSTNRGIRARTWPVRAAVRAEESYALRVAANHYDTAQTLLETDPDMAQARGWLIFDIGYLLRWSNSARGLAHLEDALHIAQRVDDPVLAIFVRIQSGLLRCIAGDLVPV